MDLGLVDKRVLVTAGAAGIGLAITRAFVAEGAHVHTCDIDDGALARLAEDAPQVATHRCDVSNRDEVQAMADLAIEQLGGLDILVNNAGVAGPTGPVESIDPDGWDHTLAVNITGTFNVTRLLVPHLKRGADPLILNISSAAGRLGFPMRSPYSAAKWAVVGFTKTLAMELGGDGVRVNAILPGIVDGPRIHGVFAAKARETEQPVVEIERGALAGMSLKRFVAPEQVADMCVLLASPRCGCVSGQAVAIDGDTHMMV